MPVFVRASRRARAHTRRSPAARMVKAQTLENKIINQIMSSNTHSRSRTIHRRYKSVKAARLKATKLYYKQIGYE